MLSEAATQGHWLCLKNLHLMTSWLPVLEKQLQSLTPHQDFRLWLTSEPHLKFPTMLVMACLKVTYEVIIYFKKTSTGVRNYYQIVTPVAAEIVYTSALITMAYE